MGNPDLSFPRGVELGWVTNKTNNSNQLPFRIGNQMNFVGTFSKSTNKNQEQMNSDGIEPAGGLGLSDKSSFSPKLWERTSERSKSTNILTRTEIVTTTNSHRAVEID